MRQETEKQRAFAELLISSFPDISDKTIDGWLENPKLLKQRLQQYDGLAAFQLPEGIKVKCTKTVTKNVVTEFIERQSMPHDTKQVLNSITEWGKPGEYELVPIMPAYLGFTTNVSYRKLRAQAERYGLRECQNNVIIFASIPYRYDRFTFATAPVQGKLITAEKTETVGGNWGGGYPYWFYSDRTRHKGKFRPTEIVMFAR